MWKQTFCLHLGISPILGRNFLPEEDRPNGPKVALITYGLWLSHFALDAGVVNKLVDIDGNQVRVIGVLPKDFEMPTLQAADVLVPEALDEAAQRKADPGRVMYAFARLKPDVSIEQAETQLQPVFNYSLEPCSCPIPQGSAPHRCDRFVIARCTMCGWSRGCCSGAVLAVLLIACANVASLLMARAAARERELAVRSVLGASRGRLIRQSLTETFLLALAGAGAGCHSGGAALARCLSPLPQPVFLFLPRRTWICGLFYSPFFSLSVCGAVFGILPALMRPRVAALTARSSGSRVARTDAACLVVGQIAISMVLLICAALLLAQFSQPRGTEHWVFNPSGVLTAHIALPRYRYTSTQQQMEFALNAEAALRRLPGVQAVGMSDSLPPGENHGHQIYSIIEVEGRPRPAGGTGGMVTWRWVTPEYFSALEIPILRGQGFTEEERTSNERYLILSSMLATRLFGDQDPIGQHVKPVPNSPWYTVAGDCRGCKERGPQRQG